MVSYLYSFNPCISISENAKYLSRSNVSRHSWEWEWTPLANFSETIYFSFRLNIGVCNFNHVDKLVSITKLKKGRINLRRTYLWQAWNPNLFCKRFTRIQRYWVRWDCCLTYMRHHLHQEWWKICVILFCFWYKLTGFHQLLHLWFFAFDSWGM